ncbi:hypothetical protein RJ639_014680 [Escallonia herrerae]|uniref:DUF1664 domain-containing protein n=1 Tax=Escallonia herrerae TaxID=1293975 RepID=A0AA88VKS7_9ASTE|nr:hypothetical protein RJ639_014680 [Escallonia herrerae]
MAKTPAMMPMAGTVARPIHVQDADRSSRRSVQRLLIRLLSTRLTGSVILRSGQLSELISQLQELRKGVNDAEISPGNYDAALLMAQIQKLAQEIRELTVSRPVTIFNGNSSSSGSYASYQCQLQQLGQWDISWSFSDVMFVTKHNMANAVAKVSKQLEHVHESLALTKKHLTKKLENLDWKLGEQKETSKLIANDVNEAKASLNQIGYDREIIHQMVSGMDMTNSGLWYLCQAAGGIKVGEMLPLFRPINSYEEQSLKGLQFIAVSNESSAVEKLMINTIKNNLGDSPAKSFPKIKSKIYRP